MKKQEISRGAEAKIMFSNGFIIKDRIKKSYRLKEIDDKIRKHRTKTEAKNLTKASKIINCPKPFFIPDFFKIKMPFIEGKRLSDYLEKLPWKKLCREIGKQIALLHDNDIIHGDLTTSNMILSNKNNEVYFIDFGLSFNSHRIEDKAVDLHLIQQALEAKHFTIWKQAFNEILKAYHSKDREKILEQLKKVESRGRYKSKV